MQLSFSGLATPRPGWLHRKNHASKQTPFVANLAKQVWSRARSGPPARIKIRYA